MSIWRWADWIDSVPAAAQIALGEGETPLLRSRTIGPRHGLANLYFKLETTNPAGSFKDRFAAGTVSHMLANNKTLCIATSSGNTGSALAAYCAAAGIKCRIAIVETAPTGKLRQMMAYGADIFRVRGFGLDPSVTAQVFERLCKIAEHPETALQISAYVYSWSGMTAVETISFELFEQLGHKIDHVFCPAGGGGLCVAAARGFATLIREAKIERSPRVHCVQPEGNDTIAGPLRRGDSTAQEVKCTTRISGLQVASVVDGQLAIDNCRPTGGTGHLVSDEETWQLQKQLAREEGIFCEPAGAVALAGAIRATAEGLVQSDDTIVCLVTGSGFKDEDSVTRMIADVECPTIDVADLQ